MRIDKITGIFQCLSCKYKGNIFHEYGHAVSKLQIKKDMLRKKLVEKLAEGVGLPFPTNRVPYEGDWRGISTETYKKFEAFTCHDKEYIGRLMFPIRDMTGRICAFQGRHMTGETPKYLNSPAGAKLPLFPKINPILGTAIIVEGMFDMLNLYDKGLKNVVCCFGVSNMTQHKLSMLQVQGVTLVYIFLDGDKAGQDGAAKLAKECDRAGLEHKNIYIKNKDPGELSSKQVKALKKKLYGEIYESCTN
jgi:5S rRNA maturation endonuclease (ribonuclease M5)